MYFCKLYFYKLQTMFFLTTLLHRFFFRFVMADSLRAAAVARVVLPDNPQRCIDADRAVGPTDEADEHDEGEILCRFPAEEMESTAGTSRMLPMATPSRLSKASSPNFFAVRRKSLVLSLQMK